MAPRGGPWSPDHFRGGAPPVAAPMAPAGRSRARRRPAPGGHRAAREAPAAPPRGRRAPSRALPPRRRLGRGRRHRPAPGPHPRQLRARPTPARPHRSARTLLGAISGRRRGSRTRPWPRAGGPHLHGRGAEAALLDAPRADQAAPPRPAAPRGGREHLCAGGLLARADPPRGPRRPSHAGTGHETPRRTSPHARRRTRERRPLSSRRAREGVSRSRSTIARASPVRSLSNADPARGAGGAGHLVLPSLSAGIEAARLESARRTATAFHHRAHREHRAVGFNGITPRRRGRRGLPLPPQRHQLRLLSDSVGCGS